MWRVVIMRDVLRRITLGFAGLVCLTCTTEGQGGPAIMQGDFGEEVVQHGELRNRGVPVFHTQVGLTIGGSSDLPEGRFGEVVGADIVGEGAVGVLDGQFAEVRIFDADGGFRGRASRFGSGPGEISGEGTLGIVGVGNSMFLVPDIVNLTVQTFHIEGALVSAELLDMAAGELPIEWRDGGDSQVSVRMASANKSVIVRRHVSGTNRDTLAVVDGSGPTMTSDGLQPIWVDHVLWTTDERGIAVVGETSRSQFTLYKDGRRLRTVVWEVGSRELTATQQDTLLRIVAGRLGWDDNELPDGFRERFRLPTRLPAIADIEIVDDIVLVQRVRPVGSMNRQVTHTLTAVGLGGRRWDAFSVAGRYLGIVDMGAQADVFGIRGDTIVGVRTDNLGVQEVFLARVPVALREEAIREQGMSRER